MGYVIFMLWVAAAAAVGAWIGYSVKGRPLTGFLLGVFLGWLGVLILLFLPRTAEKKVQREMRSQAIREETSQGSGQAR